MELLKNSGIPIVSKFLPPELWDLILQKLLKIDAKEVAEFRLLSKYFNELILNNKNIKYKLYFAGRGVLHKNPYKKLEQACKDGHIEIVKWMVSNSDITTDPGWKYDVFHHSCEYGHLHILQWLHSIFNLTSELRDVQNELILAVESGYLEIVLWLLNTFKFSSTEIFKKSPDVFFSRACRKGHLSVAKWLADITTVTSLDVTRCRNKILCDICWDKYGEFYSLKISDNSILETLKWAIENFNLSEKDVKFRNNRIFRCACKGGKLNIIKWLLQDFPSIKKDFEEKEVYILNYACQYGHLDIIKWAVETFNITDEKIECCCSDAFGYACIRGNLEMMRWLSDNFSSVPRLILKSYYLEQTCKRGHLDVLQFILEKLNQEDRKWAIEILQTSCKHNCLELAKCAVNRLHLTKDEINSQNYKALKSACERKCLSVVEWLIKNYY